VEREEKKIEYFKIAGFTFLIQSYYKDKTGKVKGSASTVIPFTLKSPPKPTEIKEVPKPTQGINISTEGAFKDFSKIGGGTTTGATATLGAEGLKAVAKGTTIYVDLEEIGFEDFVLDEENNVISGSFSVELNRDWDLEDNKCFKLLSIYFTPNKAEALIQLDLGKDFNSQKLLFETEVKPQIQFSGKLELKEDTILSNPFGKDIQIVLYKGSFIKFINEKIHLTDVKGKLILNYFQHLCNAVIEEGHFVFSKTKVGILLNQVHNVISIESAPGIFINMPGGFKKAVYAGSTPLLGGGTSSSSNLPDPPNPLPQGKGSFPQKQAPIAGGAPSQVGTVTGPPSTKLSFYLNSGNLIGDFCDFSKPENEDGFPVQWVGVAMDDPSLSVPVNIPVMQNMELDFKLDKDVDLDSIQINGTVTKAEDELFNLFSPYGFKLNVKAGSSLGIINNSIISADIKATLCFPDYLREYESGSPLEVEIPGFIPPNLSLEDKDIYVGKLLKLQGTGLAIAGMGLRVTLKGSSSKMEFISGNIMSEKYPKIKLDLTNFYITGNGIYGWASQAIEEEMVFHGFPINVKGVELHLAGTQVTQFDMVGLVEFPLFSKDGEKVEKPCHLNLKSNEEQVNVGDEFVESIKSFLGEDYTYSEKIFDGYFFEIDLDTGIIKGTTAKFQGKLKLKFAGFTKTYPLVDFKFSPLEIIEKKITIGDIVKFFGLDGIELPWIKISTEGSNHVIQFEPKFKLCDSPFNFPLKVNIKLKSNGEMESVKAKGGIHAKFPTVEFKGDANFNMNEDGFEVKVLSASIWIKGDFSYTHKENLDYDYWRVYLATAGVIQIPLGIGLSIYGIGGGMAYNMQVETNLKTFKAKFTPQPGSLVFQASADIGTDDGGYTLYSRGTLTVSFYDSGSAGEISFTAKAWTFTEDHSGTPPYMAGWQIAWGDNTEITISVGLRYEKPGIIKLPKGSGYNVAMIYIDSSGVEVNVGTKSSPWTASLFGFIDGKAYAVIKVLSSYVGGEFGFSLEVSKKVDWKLSIDMPWPIPDVKCNFYAGVKGKANADLVIDIYPDFQFDFTGKVYAHAYAGCCIGEISVSGKVLLHISAPDPKDFTITLEIGPIDLWIKEVGPLSVELDIV